VRSGLLEQGLHFADLGLLGGDDLLSELVGGGVGALGQLGLGHADGTLMVGDHHWRNIRSKAGPLAEVSCCI
jgi:hypothetical protein